MGDKRRPGRPRKGEGRAFWEGQLHSVLVAKMPARVLTKGRIDRRLLAAELGLAGVTVGRWMNLDRLSSKAARKLVDVDGATITREDLVPFII